MRVSITLTVNVIFCHLKANTWRLKNKSCNINEPNQYTSTWQIIEVSNSTKQHTDNSGNHADQQKRSKDRKINGKCTNGTNRRSRVLPVFFTYILLSEGRRPDCVRFALSFARSLFSSIKFRILAAQNLEFRILAVQNLEFGILAVQNLEFRILAAQNLEFRILAAQNQNPADSIEILKHQKVSITLKLALHQNRVSLSNLCF